MFASGEMLLMGTYELLDQGWAVQYPVMPVGTFRFSIHCRHQQSNACFEAVYGENATTVS